MIELKGTWGRTYYVFRVSSTQVMSFVPPGTKVPGSVVRSVHLRALHPGHYILEHLRTINGFVVESWVIR